MQFKLEDMPPDTKPYKVLLWDHIKNMKSTTVLNKEGAQEAYRKIGWSMVATCLSDDGIGLAAPQCGIFKKALLIREFETNEDGVTLTYLPSFRLYLNPTWNGLAEKGKTSLKEWCLSVPGKGYPIERFNEVTASWFEFESGELVQKEGIIEHFPARIFQHEYDHLVGISIPQRWKMQNIKTKAKPKRKKKK